VAFAAAMPPFGDTSEGIDRGFLQGYHAALEEGRPDRLGSMLDGIASGGSK
jgi:hypothetical protein